MAEKMLVLVLVSVSSGHKGAGEVAGEAASRRIKGGMTADIAYFPHAGFLYQTRVKDDGEEDYIIEDDKRTVELRYLPVPFVPIGECEVETGFDMEGKVCAGFGSPLRTTAFGDSGGGLMVDVHHVVATLNGDFWGALNIDIYANISYHYAWIQEELWRRGVTSDD